MRDVRRPGPRETALPRLPRAARRALEADGLTTLDDVVLAGRHHVVGLPGVDRPALEALDDAVRAAGLCDAEAGPDEELLAATG